MRKNRYPCTHMHMQPHTQAHAYASQYLLRNTKAGSYPLHKASASNVEFCYLQEPIYTACLKYRCHLGWSGKAERPELEEPDSPLAAAGSQHK